MFPPFKPVLYHRQVKCKFLQNRQNWLRFQILKGSFLVGQQPVIYETTAFFFFCIRNKWFWSLLKWGELTFDLECVLPMAFAGVKWGKVCGGDLSMTDLAWDPYHKSEPTPHTAWSTRAQSPRVDPDMAGGKMSTWWSLTLFRSTRSSA